MVVTLMESYFLFHLGYKSGEASVEKILSGGAVKQLITGASVLGLFMMGGLASSYVKVSTPIKIVTGVKTLSIQNDVLTGVYFYLEKVDHNYTRAMLIIIALAVVLGSLNILK